MANLERMLTTAEAKGTSSLEDENADDTIWLNRAGPGEKPLHRDEIIEFFVIRRIGPNRSTLAEFRKGLPRCGATCPARRDRNGCASHCPKCWGTDYVRAITEP